MGRPLPDHPTLFIKFADTLTGPYDDLVVPKASAEVDWEVELGVVIGRAGPPGRRGRRRRPASPATPSSTTSRCGTGSAARTQWDQGKNFEASTPVGPFLVTGDEIGDAVDLEVTCRVDGETMQTRPHLPTSSSSRRPS